MKNTRQVTLPILLSALVLGLSGAPAVGQDTLVEAPPPVEASPTTIIQPPDNTDLLPPVRAATPADNIDQDSPTHPAVKLTPDKSELIRLNGSASTVLVGNPAHLSILPSGTDTLVLVPKAPGATYFTVLDENGQVIMQRHVIVASPKEKYVRIRKSCAIAEKGCQPTQVYYCPDMCHEIILNAEAAAGGSKARKSDAVSSEIDEASNEEDEESGADGDETTE